MKKSLLVLMSICSLSLLNGCGTSAPPPPPPPPPVATHFSVSAPATITAGTAFNVTVSALDSSNSVVPGYSGTVHFASTDAQAVLPADSPLTSGTGTFSVTLKTATNQTITVTDTGTLTGTSSGTAVSAGPATRVSVTLPSAATAGITLNFSVTVFDAYNNVATGYAGMLHFSSSDSQAVFPTNPGTLTGSIGVIMQLANVEGLLRKVGVDYVVVKAGAYKDIGSFARPMRPEERQVLQALLDDVYGQFVTAVAEHRGLDRKTVLGFADGRIYSGQQARALKMVDDLGGLQEAIEAAGKLAGIPGKPKVIYPRRRFSLRDLLSNQFGPGGATSLLPALPSLKTPLYLMP